jgi:O-methyltransferase/methyltransferase family protein
MAEEIPHGPQRVPAAEHREELFRLLAGYRVSQALYVAATLGLADRLADGPVGSEELARATGTHPGALYRLLRFLAGAGLFLEVAPRRFALTPLGAGLRADAPDSIRPFALMLLDEVHWPAWGQLLHSVRTGETAFARVHGAGFFDYLARHPEAAGIFQRAMTSNTAQSGEAITWAYDFGGIGRLVDVGGGQGLLLATVLRAHPAMRGVLFDRPEVVAGAGATLEAAGVAERCEVVGGDFFRAVPPGGDAYLLRQVVHDWDDARAAVILAHCRGAMGRAGRLLVVERALASDHRRAMPELHLDLEMLVNLGGLQRTDAEYGALFAAAGFRLSAIVPLGDAAHFSVFEGLPADAGLSDS